MAGLCNWAAAMCTYHEVAKVVEPKIVALRGAEAKLKVAMREKGAALDELAIVQGRLDEMQARTLLPSCPHHCGYYPRSACLVSAGPPSSNNCWRPGRLVTPVHHVRL